MANLNVEFKGNGIIKTWSKIYSFQCFIVPRNSVSTAIPDIKTDMAVYFLVNSLEGRIDSNGNETKRQLYVGKTSKGMVRFFSHKSNKEFWDKIFYFTADRHVFDEDMILGLENLLITKYKRSGLYIMEQEGSDKHIDEECEVFGDQIVSIMDFYNYPCEKEEIEEKPVISDTKDDVKRAEETSDLFKKFDQRVRNIDLNHIKVEQLKLYTAYRFENKNLCAVWVHSYGLELELYINQKDIKTTNADVYDITFRKRGKKESGMKIEREEQFDQAISILREIINK